MSEPFPTKTDVEFFASEEAKPIQELWEPKPYDVLHIKGQLKLILKPEAFGDEPESIAYVYSCPYDRDPMGVMRGAGLEWHPRKNITWLPRPHQLWEILEERGLKGGTWKVGRMTPPEKNAYLLADCEVSHDDEYIALCSQLPPRKPFFGPTPAIALGRALLEAIQRGKK